MAPRRRSTQLWDDDSLALMGGESERERESEASPAWRAVLHSSAAFVQKFRHLDWEMFPEKEREACVPEEASAVDSDED